MLLKKNYNKAVSFLLTVLMTFSVVSSGAWAVEGTEKSGDLGAYDSNINLLSDSEYPMILDKVEGDNIETFYIERPDPEALKDNVVNASDFGLSVTKEDNYDAFAAALAYCKAHPNTILNINKGVYYFKTDASLQLSGLKNVLIEGNGAEFIFETQKQFVVSGSDGVELRNLIIDWNWEKNRIASLVQIQNKTKTSFEIKFLELDEVDEDIPIVSFQQYDNVDHVPGTYGSWKTFNPAEVPGSIVGVEKTEPNVLRVDISSRFTTSFHNGEVYILRHYTYGGAVFNTHGGSSNITFNNVNIYGSAGMGFVFGNKANRFQVINSYIGLRPGSEDKTRMATTADGIHILNTNGYFRIDNCDLSYTGDDIFNIHDDLLMVTELNSKNQVFGNVTGGFVEKGDTIRIYNTNIEDIGFETEVVAFTRAGNTGTLTLKDELPTEVNEGYFIYRSSDRTHNYVISNNYIHETKGRGALLNAPDGLFENNVLYRTVSECVEVRVDLSDKPNKFWYEGSGANNVVVSNNVFEECAFGGKASIIKIDCNIGTNSDVLSDIHIINNEFLHCYGADTLISADNVSNLYIENNLFADCGEMSISNDCGEVHYMDNIIDHPSERCEHTDTKNIGVIPVGCVEYGYTGKVYCNQCHTIIVPEGKAIVPLKHKNSVVKRIDLEPTCTTDGLSSNVCTLCKAVIETNIVEPATGHIPGPEATTTTPQECTVCHEILKEPIYVPATGISLNETSLSLPTKESIQLEAAILPLDTTDTTIKWSSSNTSVATVSETGVVTALRYGTAVITAETVNGLKATCTVNTKFYDVAGSGTKGDANYQYYYTPVYWAFDAGITTGYDRVYFGVGEYCTRSAVMIFLWRLAGSPAPKNDANLYFNDVSAYSTTSSANRAIAWAYENGVSKGYKDGSFGVDKPIARKDVLIMLYRMAGKPSVSGKMIFPDCTDYASGSDTYNAIIWGSSKGITSGFSDGTFRPTANCLREEIITFLYRYKNK